MIGAAGELATRLRVTGWKEGDATQAAATCFAAWFSKRGSKGASDVEAGIRKVKAFIELHGSSRFQEIKLLDDDQPPQKTFHRTGFFEKKPNGNVYYILPESFKEEVCAGYNAEAVLKELKRQGHLQCDADDRLTYKKTLPGFGKKGSYAILPSLFQEPDAPQRASLSEVLDEDAA